MKKNYLNMIIEAHLYDLNQTITRTYYDKLYLLFRELDRRSTSLYIDESGGLNIQKPFIMSVEIDLNPVEGWFLISDQANKEVLFHENHKSNGDVESFRFVWEVADT